ncbi:hypothetical protein LQF12_01545 [Ruania suaedae]|uniref:hypothetical protein n=1 Tax=Ruania suaedae TaxID=2897774 RepID=UPI001E548B69|nr:hypothetical protein [Ruania suaedae]UFU03324.1 hypothetical protein LQF12_01545 [Ruania suaedae]
MSTPPSPQPYDAPDGGSYSAPGAPARAAGPGAYGYSPHPQASTNPPGRIALAAGIAIVVLGLVQQGMSYFLPTLAVSLDLSVSSMLSLVYGPLNVVLGLLAVTATIAGAIGIRRAAAPRLAAAAGLALGLSAAATTLLSLLMTALTAVI